MYIYICIYIYVYIYVYIYILYVHWILDFRFGSRFFLEIVQIHFLHDGPAVGWAVKGTDLMCFFRVGYRNGDGFLYIIYTPREN